MSSEGWASYLRTAMDARRIGRASDLAKKAGVSESLISRWLRGESTPDIPNLRRIAPVLRRPLLELMVQAGHLTTQEARLREVPALVPAPAEDVADVIRRDEGLIDEAREHLLNQYALLRRIAPVSVEADTKPALRAVAEHGDPADRAALSNLAREARENYERQKGAGTNGDDHR